MLLRTTPLIFGAIALAICDLGTYGAGHKNLKLLAMRKVETAARKDPAEIPELTAPPETDEAIRLGRIAWKTEDAKGRSCISCHSPEGMELALYNFSDENIVRRATAHVNKEEALQIVSMVHALREKYGITKLLDPMEDRPLQPGNRPLTGSTSEQREIAFSKVLAQKTPTLATGTVDSLAKARKAQHELLSIDLTSLPIGIPMSRLSEDFFHGKEHATLADWIPDVPVPLSPEAIAARDRYQSEPTELNFSALEATLTIDPQSATFAQRMAMAKYRSLLLLQHPWKHLSSESFSPIWDFADLGRTAQPFQIDQLGLPDDIRAKKVSGPPLDEQLKQIRLAWFWLGWTRDPGLQYIPKDRKGKRADYFSLALLNEGPYPLHCAFMILRKQFSESFDPASWNSPNPQHFVLNYSGFLTNENYLGYMPHNAELAARYRTFVSNSFRTSLFLLVDETKRTHLCDYKIPELSSAKTITDYLIRTEPSSKVELQKLLSQVQIAMQDATEKGGGGYGG